MIYPHINNDIIILINKFINAIVRYDTVNIMCGFVSEEIN